MNKNVHITFDYELFFGASTGTVEKCLIAPTKRLISLAEAHKAKFVFFIDAGYLNALKKFSVDKKCHEDYKRVADQIGALFHEGHEIALHVHPHWEDCEFGNGEWKMNITRYRLADFTEAEIMDIISRYHEAIIDITGKPCHSFRAGGWSIQPFSKVKRALAENRIFIDSSVYKNGYHRFTAQSYDFRKAPDKQEWRFEEDECKEDRNGTFLELPATPDRISPAFYFSMYFKMRSDPAYFRPSGDGAWVKDRKKIYRQFYAPTDHFACCDGYFASRLKKNLVDSENRGKNRFVALGHPKSLAACSYDYLDEFLKFASSKGYSLTTFYESADQ